MLPNRKNKFNLVLVTILALFGMATVYLLNATLPVKRHPDELSGVTQQAEKPVNLEFRTLQLNSFAPYIQSLIKAFETQHPNVRVHWVDIPFQDAEKRALSAILSDDVPDVMNLNPNFAALLAQRNTLLNVAPLLDREQIQAYVPAVWQSLQLEQTQLGLPWYLTSQVTFYNKELLNKAGWQKLPQTMSELLALGADLQRCCPATYALMPNLGESGQFLRNLQLAGLALPKAGQAFSFHKQAKAVAFLAAWVDVYQKGYMPPESLSEGHQAAVQRYQAGQLVLLPAGVSLVSNLQSNAPEVFKQTRVAGQFLLHTQEKTAGTVDVASMILVLPKRSKHPKEALALALFVTQASAQKQLAQLAPVLPSTVASYPLKAGASPLLNQAVAFSSQQLFQARQTVGLHPKQALLNRFIDVAVQEALLRKKTPQQALAWFDEQVNRQL
jgi:putative chitobiose transport system substrate-binding protein